MTLCCDSACRCADALVLTLLQMTSTVSVIAGWVSSKCIASPVKVACSARRRQTALPRRSNRLQLLWKLVKHKRQQHRLHPSLAHACRPAVSSCQMQRRTSAQWLQQCRLGPKISWTAHKSMDCRHRTDRHQSWAQWPPSQLHGSCLLATDAAHFLCAATDVLRSTRSDCHQINMLAWQVDVHMTIRYDVQAAGGTPATYTQRLHLAAWSCVILHHTCVISDELQAILLPALGCSSCGAAVRLGSGLRWNADGALLYIWPCLGQLPLALEEHHQVVHLQWLSALCPNTCVQLCHQLGVLHRAGHDALAAQQEPN